MLFIDLEQLDIIESQDYRTIQINVALDSNNAAAEIKAQLDKACKSVTDFAATEWPIQYIINIDCPKIKMDDFITICNLATMSFFAAMVTEGGRARERRLDIPTTMQKVHVSAGLLKRAINTKTVVNKFNLYIQCDKCLYKMVDEKGTK